MKNVMMKNAWVYSAFCLPMLAATAQAGELYKDDNFTLESEVTLSFNYQAARNVNFGAGDYGDGKQNPRNAEPWVEVGLKGSYQLDGSEIYGGLSYQAAKAYEDGEITGQYGVDGDSDFGHEQAYLGWRNDTLDISVGSQDFMIGDGLIIGDGNFDTGTNNGQFWAGARFAWKQSLIAKIDQPWGHVDAFYLEADIDYTNNSLKGINYEKVVQGESGTLGAMYVTVDRDGSAQDGLELLSIRGSDFTLPFSENLTLRGEYIHQFGDNNGTDFDGDAWYLETSYVFAEHDWAPTLTYRYFVADGDDASTSGKNEGYQGLNYGPSRSWDTWIQGEISGGYYLFNENQETHMLKLSVYPAETYGVSLAAFRNNLNDTSQYFGNSLPAGTDSHFMDELNLVFEYYPNDNLYIAAILAYAKPGEAGNTALGGSDKNMSLAELAVTYTF